MAKFLRSNILSKITGVSGRNYPGTRRFMERNQHFKEHGLPCGLCHVHLTFSGGCTIAQVESTYAYPSLDLVYYSDEIKESVPAMFETKDSVDFYWDPV